MGIHERKEREREQRKKTILDCSMRIFMHKGIATATMDEIAECAELSKATLYLYFKSKDEIVFQAIGCVIENFTAYIENEYAGANSVQEKMRGIGEAYLRFYRENYGQYVLFNSQDSATHVDYSKYEFYSEVLQKSNRLWQLICEPIIEAVQAGYLRADTNAIELALTLWGASNGILNLMSHVDSTHRKEDFAGYIEQDSYLAQMSTLDYEKMLRNLWEAAISQYRAIN